eukprot:COSAG02_NODE_10351_length_1962_cov_1.491143_3_plen_230_part_00
MLSQHLRSRWRAREPKCTLTSRCSRSDANKSLFNVTLACIQLESSTANWIPSAGVAVHTAVCDARCRTSSGQSIGRTVGQSGAQVRGGRGGIGGGGASPHLAALEVDRAEHVAEQPRICASAREARGLVGHGVSVSPPSSPGVARAFGTSVSFFKPLTFEFERFEFTRRRSPARSRPSSQRVLVLVASSSSSSSSSSRVYTAAAAAAAAAGSQLVSPQPAPRAVVVRSH